MTHPIRMLDRPARLGAFLVVASLSLLGADAVRAEAIAKQVIGQVEIGQGEPPVWRALEVGAAIAPNDRIRTGADGRVEVEMGAGTLRVHENSLLRLPPPSEHADRVDLEKGNSLFDVLRRAGRRFEVHTPTVVVSVKGTRFGVDASSEVGAVHVFHGVVGVREAGVADAIETLVREGFLATGGAGSPIELDVAPTGDPWASWQDFRREVGERRAAPTRLNEIDQARSVLHRTTSEAVIRRAAERRPEVAERLQQLEREQKKRAAQAAKDTRGDAPVPSVPAAPMPTGSHEEGSMHRMIRENGQHSMRDQMRQKRQAAIQQRIQQEAMMEEMTSTEDMTGDATFSNGETGLSQDAMMGLDGQTLIDVLQAREEVWADFVTNTAAAPGAPPWTPGQFMMAMQQALIDRGYDAATAAALVNQLTGN